MAVFGGWRCTVPPPSPTRGPGPRNSRIVKGQNGSHDFLTKVMLEPVVGESPKPIDCWCSLSLAVERVFWKPLTAAPSRTTPPHPPQIMKRLAQKWRMQAGAQLRGHSPFPPKAWLTPRPRVALLPVITPARLLTGSLKRIVVWIIRLIRLN